ncbi:MAG: selenide, water dikinase SelD, partial [Sedimentitalea sp.]
MIDPDMPLTRDLVLIGGGHTHALVLRKWAMNPLAGVRVTLINPGPTAPYSGMLPGHVAGHYGREDLDIDLVRLARFAGARLILGAVNDIDLARREVHVPGRAAIAYDACAVDVGITSAMPRLAGFSDHAVPAKPLGTFAARWRAYLSQTGAAQIAVIGAGVAGAELAMAMAFALKHRGRPAEITLIDRSQALSATGPRARAIIRAAMDALDVTVLEDAAITQITADHVVLDDGRQIAASFVTGAAGARPFDWLAQTGLTHKDGFIDVGETLQSSDPTVFAVGDCAHMRHDPRPKAGVYAVRQAPVLLHNLRAVLSGGTLRPYHPQKDYLKLISLGGKRALAERLGTTFSGSLMWRWKDHIDQTFMNQFRDLPTMETPKLPAQHALGLRDALGAAPMCGGCGAKVGRRALRGALAGHAGAARDDVRTLAGDDAALLITGGQRQVISTDHLRALSNDPVIMARLAALHALGDIWAMGAQPQAATASVILPRMSAALQQRTMGEIMHSASAVMAEAGAALVGGHSSVGSELTIGFTLTGLCANEPITLAGARPGDVLILSKPIGSGVVMAGEMQGRAAGAWVAAALDMMGQSQKNAAHILASAHAMTDVTGFGLAGHLLNICEASGVAATLNAGAVPLMEGALQLSQNAVRSSLFDENRALVP